MLIKVRKIAGQSNGYVVLARSGIVVDCPLFIAARMVLGTTRLKLLGIILELNFEFTDARP